MFANKARLLRGLPARWGAKAWRSRRLAVVAVWGLSKSRRAMACRWVPAKMRWFSLAAISACGAD